jgi:RNA polymerase sigma-70 factor (ECF subfamily)
VPCRAGRFVDVPENEIEETMRPSTSTSLDKRLADRELVGAIETAIEELPARYRAVFMLRDVEEINTAETAECLDIPKHSVETRLRRARALLRQKLTRESGVAVRKSFTLGVARCDRMVAGVLMRIKAATPPPADAGGEQRESSTAAWPRSRE